MCWSTEMIGGVPGMATECKYCRVQVDDQHETCPLCATPLGQEARESATQYPGYHKREHVARNFTIPKLFLFLSIIAGTVSLLINLCTLSLYPGLWSLLVIGSLVFVWIVYRTIFSKNLVWGGKILFLFLSLSGLLIGIDGYTGFGQWSTTYVIPFLTIALTFLMTLIAITKKGRYEEYMGFLLSTFFISLCPVLFCVFSLASALWASMATITYSFLTIVGLVLFSEQKFKTEIKKRFHI